MSGGNKGLWRYNNSTKSRGVSGNTTGPTASLPAPGNAGNTYWPANGSYLYEDNGVSWQAFGPIQPMTPPIPANFMWVNQSTATETFTNGCAFINNSTSAGETINASLRLMTVPTAPYTVTIACNPFFTIAPSGPSYSFALPIAWYNSTSTNLFVLNIRNDTSIFNYAIDEWASPTTGGTELVAPVNINFIRQWPSWFRGEDDGTNRNLYWGDGYNWFKFYTTANNTYFVPTHIGYGVLPYNTEAGMSVYSWVVGV